MAPKALALVAVLVSLLAAQTTLCRAQSAEAPLAARNGQVVLPYAEQKFRGAVGTTFEDSDPATFPAPIAAPKAHRMFC